MQPNVWEGVAGFGNQTLISLLFWHHGLQADGQLISRRAGGWGGVGEARLGGLSGAQSGLVLMWRNRQCLQGHPWCGLTLYHGGRLWKPVGYCWLAVDSPPWGLVPHFQKKLRVAYCNITTPGRQVQCTHIHVKIAFDESSTKTLHVPFRRIIDPIQSGTNMGKRNTRQLQGWLSNHLMGGPLQAAKWHYAQLNACLLPLKPVFITPRTLMCRMCTSDFMTW